MKRDKGKFVKGKSGNPLGRQKGSKNAATIIAENLLQGSAEDVTNKAVELALAGDTTAIKIILDRITPPMKEQKIELSLPQIQTSSDLILLQAHIIQNVAEGKLTPTQGQIMTNMALKLRESFEVEKLESRIKELESHVRENH